MEKTESDRQLSVSLPCLSCEGGVGHRGKRELRRQRPGERKRERGDRDQEERKWERQKAADSSVSPAPVWGVEEEWDTEGKES